MHWQQTAISNILDSSLIVFCVVWEKDRGGILFHCFEGPVASGIGGTVSLNKETGNYILVYPAASQITF